MNIACQNATTVRVRLSYSVYTMEVKLVYRGLRQISDWALRFYSEVHVDGTENVPPDGPLIMCVSC